MSVRLSNDLGLFDNMPWAPARRDVRAVSRILIHARIDRGSPLGTEVFSILCKRTSECRDFFVLRGARTRTSTVLRMAARSLAKDTEEATRLDVFAAGQGRTLLRALAILIEQIACHGPPTRTQHKSAAERANVCLAGVQSERPASPSISEAKTFPSAKPASSPANDDAPAEERVFVAA